MPLHPTEHAIQSCQRTCPSDFRSRRANCSSLAPWSVKFFHDRSATPEIISDTTLTLRSKTNEFKLWDVVRCCKNPGQIAHVYFSYFAPCCPVFATYMFVMSRFAVIWYAILLSCVCVCLILGSCHFCLHWQKATKWHTKWQQIWKWQTYMASKLQKMTK